MVELKSRIEIEGRRKLKAWSANLVTRFLKKVQSALGMKGGTDSAGNFPEASSTRMAGVSELLWETYGTCAPFSKEGQAWEEKWAWTRTSCGK